MLLLHPYRPFQAFASVAKGLREVALALKDLVLKDEVSRAGDGAAALDVPSESNTLDFGWVLEIDADELDTPIIEAIIDLLRKLTNGARITLRQKEKGSVRLVFASSKETFVRLRVLFEQKALRAMLGHPIKDIYQSSLEPVQDNRKNDRLKTKHVLIGEPDLQRFQRLQHILERAFELKVIQTKTFDKIEEGCKARIGELKLILLTERLPYSDQQQSILIEAYFEQLVGIKLRTACGAWIGYVYEDEGLLKDVNHCNFFIPFPNSEETEEIFLERFRGIFLNRRK
jgi:hypothetical protein